MQATNFPSKALLQAIKGKGGSSQDICTCCHDCQIDHASLAMTAGILQGKWQHSQGASFASKQGRACSSKACHSKEGAVVLHAMTSAGIHLRRDCRSGVVWLPRPSRGPLGGGQ